MDERASDARRRRVRHRWRDYTTPAGRRPVKDFLAGLSDVDAASVAAAMKEVQLGGLRMARHLRNDIYEVRADGERATYRVLFAPEGKGRVLLALEALSKKTQKTPKQVIDLAENRLSRWRSQTRKL
jgi:phage-related protein